MSLLFALRKRPPFITRIKKTITRFAWIVLAVWGAYYFLWAQYLYTVTAYCDCPICINVAAYHDGRFASGKRVYWGGAAMDPSVPFNAVIELVPHWPQDWLATLVLLKGRRDFQVEDRGGKIKGRDIDLFIPDSLGGHETARQWGVRRMRIKLNGVLDR